jgi:hypothetical protein
MMDENLKADYDGYSPVTGNFCVLAEADETTNVTSYMCMESGYNTSELLKIGSAEAEKYEETLTELMRDARIEVEETGLVWYPSFLQFPFGMLYLGGTSASDMHWEVAEIVDVHDHEKTKYPIPGQEGQYFTSKLDVDNAKVFDKLDFASALDALYSIVQEDIS